MHRKQNEITDKKQIESVLIQGDVCRLALIDNGLPYIVPVNYGYGNNTIYIHSGKHGRKIEILEQNPIVCFEIELPITIIKSEIPCKWSAKYRSVIGYATVQFITDFEQKKLALDIIMQHYGKTTANIYSNEQVNSVLILQLTITKITGKQSGNWD